MVGIAYLVVRLRDEYKIWCRPRAVKEKRGRKKHFSNCTFCGPFLENKTACLSFWVVGVGHTFPASRVYTRYVPRNRLHLKVTPSCRTIRRKDPSVAGAAQGGPAESPQEGGEVR